MTDATVDARTRDGSPDDRKPSTANAVSYGALLGLVTGAADWLILDCYAGGHWAGGHWAGGHWHYVPPSQQLIEVAAPIVFLPAALWMGQAFSVIADIIMRRLKRADQT